MRIPRIYTATPLSLQQNLSLSVQASRHITSVLRLKIGDHIILFDGQGGQYRAHIVQLDKRITVETSDFEDHSCESPLQIHLAQVISKGDRMDYTLQKSVELGVSSIQPLFSRRSVVKLKGSRLEKRQQHWQEVIISACEQCGRNRLPELKPTLNLEQWLQQSQAEATHPHLILDPQASETLSQREHHPEQTLLIGPEGGLSKEEIQLAQQHNFEGVCIGPRILRTETAALVALTVLQAHWGDV
ncbi:MAG: 16S rRNA (uracil(1498)-N(3))-methyltransferase [Gammaproteobacteria bacterium]|nr:16S rRNA (uracil(1498)-N(3))-methyltransferase [Gammaproteobacteria bacterium]